MYLILERITYPILNVDQKITEKIVLTLQDTTYIELRKLVIIEKLDFYNSW